jgi:hypothetical protein
MAETEPPRPPQGAQYNSARVNAPPMHSTALLVRETDLMRTGIESDLLEITSESLMLRTKEPFAVNDAVKIHLVNPIQRCDKETRGMVREVRGQANGSVILSIELLTRLTALEASLFKMGIPSQDTDSKPRWV